MDAEFADEAAQNIEAGAPLHALSLIQLEWGFLKL